MSSIISKKEFARLVQQHAQQVNRFTDRLMPDRLEAEEVAQDAFVKAYRSLSSFRGEASFLAWVLRIAYHEAMNRLHRRQPRMVDMDELPLTDEADDEAELSTGREERILRLEEAVGLLPPDEQLLLHLYYYDDRPLGDIAYIMDAEPGTLATRLHRIRKKLLTMIKQKEHEQTE